MVRDEFLGAAGFAGGGGGGNPTTPSDLVAVTYSNNPLGGSATSSIGIYQWSSSGFGAQIANSPINLIALGTGSIGGMCFSPDRTKFFFTSSNSPYIHGYNVTNAAIGAKLSNPAVIPSPIEPAISGLVVSKNNDFVAFGTDSLPYLNVYALTPSGFGAKVANPSTQNFPGAIAGSSGLSVDFAPDQSAIVLGYTANSSGVYTAAWRWSSSGFGTQYANVNWGSNGYSEACRGIQFTPDGQAVVGVRNSSAVSGDSLRAWRWTYNNGFGLVYSNPTTAWTGSPWFQTTRSVSVSPANNAIMCTSAGSAQEASNPGPMHVFRWNVSTGFGAIYSNQAAGIGFGSYNQSDCAKFSSDGGHIILTTYNQPLNFTATNRLISTFSFNTTSGPVFLSYAPITITNGGARWATFN